MYNFFVFRGFVEIFFYKRFVGVFRILWFLYVWNVRRIREGGDIWGRIALSGYFFFFGLSFL